MNPCLVTFCKKGRPGPNSKNSSGRKTWPQSFRRFVVVDVVIFKSSGGYSCNSFCPGGHIHILSLSCCCDGRVLIVVAAGGELHLVVFVVTVVVVKLLLLVLVLLSCWFVYDVYTYDDALAFVVILTKFWLSACSRVVKSTWVVSIPASEKAHKSSILVALPDDPLPLPSFLPVVDKYDDAISLSPMSLSVIILQQLNILVANSVLLDSWWFYRGDLLGKLDWKTTFPGPRRTCLSRRTGRIITARTHSLSLTNVPLFIEQEASRETTQRYSIKYKDPRQQ